MKRIVLILILSLSVIQGWSQSYADPKSISMMGVALQGPDSVFLPALESVGFVQVHPDDPEPDTYYMEGDFYGIKSSLSVTVDEHTKLLYLDFSAFFFLGFCFDSSAFFFSASALTLSLST